MIRFPEQWEENYHLLGSLLLDSFVLCAVTHGNPAQMKLGSIKQYGDENVQKKILTRIQDPRQYQDLMIELYTCSWHTLENHAVTPLETEGYPDLRVEYPNYPDPIYIECKHLWSPTKTAIRSAITDANRQLRKAGDSYGVLNVDVSEIVSAGKVNNDELPKRLLEIKDIISNLISKQHYRSIGAIMLFWTDFLVQGEPPEPQLYVFRRRSIRLDHNGPHKMIPSGMPLFKSYSYGFFMLWTPRRV